MLKRLRKQWFEWDLESIGTTLSWIILILFLMVVIILTSPFLIGVAIILFIYFSLVNLYRAIIFIKDKIFVTISCILAGMLMGVCGGWPGMLAGGGTGFFIGVMLECIRCEDFTPIRIAPIPFDRPWSWRGFQPSLGPKEDEIRNDTPGKNTSYERT